jgi:hypothetical protein
VPLSADDKFKLTVVLALCAAGLGSALWFYRGGKEEGCEPRSICEREWAQRTTWWLGFFTPSAGGTQSEREAHTKKLAETMAKAQHADRDDFVGIIQKIDFARRAGVLKDGSVCLPEPHDLSWSNDEYDAYSTDLAQRMAKDRDKTRHASFELDVVNYLRSKHPCPTPQ